MSTARRISSKLKTAVGVLQEADNALNAIQISATPAQISKWRDQETKARNERWDNPNAMDIYNVKISRGLHSSHLEMLNADPVQGVTKAQQQIKLLERERARNELKGQSTLLAEGLRIQEDQYVYMWM